MDNQNMGFKSAREVLEYAIKREQFAHDFYEQHRDKLADLAARQMLRELAQQEIEHKRRLQQVLDDRRYAGGLAQRPQRQDLGIARYLTYDELAADATTQDVMIAAIKFEEGSARFYDALKAMFEGHQLAELFDWLVNEEQGHKLRLERLYDEHILTDN
ncbi:MAG: ferritin family protein [Candidatus Alcyoniella australis]|nr:ferritin family protein [Candidatus Alcyoniella australis]